MRAPIIYLALAGLASVAQANPIANTDSQTETRGLVTRGLSHMFLSRSEAAHSEEPPTRRQATTPPSPLTSASVGTTLNDANRTITLTVVKGDTLGQIAKLFNSGICDIAKLNKIQDPDFIVVGQVLQVPINVAAPDNNSCINRGGAIPPANNGTAAPAPPASGGSGKKGKKQRRSVNLFEEHRAV
ncbi:intracellular hyphae protein 1 [Colletotrichum spaethianum]|uniref:Intracellular hyphae protein 1 n=1 Tax=Colletotrichum spaethianum TaxID=700344 RepID=A0AA37LDT3_9PEZI|nr:intracellular hyphae protein 1 [Colletotrichum spaethianum]GKT44568.1 intracellular hyphae protein 1 [Colletotrichum spaethianum]